MSKRLSLSFIVGIFLFSMAGSFDAEARNPCNPCGKANVCNPCSGKMSNPCNPCNSGPKQIRSKHIKDYKKLVAMGKKLWNDENLGKSGNSCITCHDDHDLLNLDKKGAGHWPHYVNMAKDIVTLDQMINFCMINPIEGKQIPANSIKMTAMSAYYSHYIKQSEEFKASHRKHRAKNPCAMKKMKHRNPCNPCGR